MLFCAQVRQLRTCFQFWSDLSTGHNRLQLQEYSFLLQQENLLFRYELYKIMSLEVIRKGN